ncbi:hypothetical protein [Enterococcus sp. CWB-B31]|uniref:hypothetical protein n=1 Tax=Enterococcus sp. CWB-B31 TaxID=2885159 RepID=UPI001E4773AE|nr:hypothetical protein [Enterococcus sp. CWB-B31]MCB5955567.1 hypothetical protein [Enterococcus sp. CWB-B31]
MAKTPVYSSDSGSAREMTEVLLNNDGQNDLNYTEDLPTVKSRMVEAIAQRESDCLLVKMNKLVIESFYV